MSQIEEEVAFEFEDVMDSQVAEEASAAERVAEVAESDPDQVTTKEVETEVETEVEAEAEVETTTTEKNEWTLTAVMDERDKRQKAVELAEKLQEKLDAYENTPEDEVSVFEDETAWKAKQDEKVQQEVRNVGLNMSQAFAEEAFGEDTVAAATKWMQDEGVKSPYILKEFNEAKLPFHKLVKLHEAELTRQNPEAYKAELKAELLKELKETAPDKPIAKSLASKRSAGESSRFPDNDEDILGT